MLHLTIFGATEAEMSPGGFTALTMFGGAELRRPTLAQRIMQRRADKGRRLSRWDRWLGQDRSMVITMFGGTDIVPPTVMEEYAALRNLVQSEAIPREEILALIEDLSAGADDVGEVSRITFCGACETGRPKPKLEQKALDAAYGARVIDSETRQQLEQAIGCPPSTAASVVARAALA